MTIAQEILDQIAFLEGALLEQKRRNAEFYEQATKNIIEARNALERARRFSSLLFWSGFTTGMTTTAFIFLL